MTYFKHIRVFGKRKRYNVRAVDEQRRRHCVHGHNFPIVCGTQREHYEEHATSLRVANVVESRAICGGQRKVDHCGHIVFANLVETVVPELGGVVGI